MTINQTRFREDFELLSSFGKTPNGGVNRPAFSTAHLAARGWIKDRAQQAGLEVRQDTAGNLIIRYASSSRTARTLILGSHLDSVPYGGKYDGALGVLAALEVLRVLKENNITLPIHLEAIDFSDEEGTLVSFLGSFAMSGKLRSIDLQNP
ncbi:MAG: M20/M25/M40 family metallo-hydrolase, partial [Anaerolineales bacterium]